MRFRRTVSVILVIALSTAFLVSPLVAAQSSTQRGREQGRRDAQQDIERVNQVIEGGWGFLFGPFAIVHALVTEPEIPSFRLGQIQNRNSEYRQNYKESYKTTIEKSTLFSRLGGWGTWMVVWVVASH